MKRFNAKRKRTQTPMSGSGGAVWDDNKLKSNAVGAGATGGTGVTPRARKVAHISASEVTEQNLAEQTALTPIISVTLTSLPHASPNFRS